MTTVYIAFVKIYGQHLLKHSNVAVTRVDRVETGIVQYVMPICKGE
jgi:hypothetical protein